MKRSPMKSDITQEAYVFDGYRALRRGVGEETLGDFTVT